LPVPELAVMRFFRKQIRVEKIAKNLRYMIFCQKMRASWPWALKPMTSGSILPILYSSSFEMSTPNPKKIQMKKFYSFKKL
jgi:hypothetical protein